MFHKCMQKSYHIKTKNDKLEHSKNEKQRSNEAFISE